MKKEVFICDRCHKDIEIADSSSYTPDPITLTADPLANEMHGAIWLSKNMKYSKFTGSAVMRKDCPEPKVKSFILCGRCYYELEKFLREGH